MTGYQSKKTAARDKLAQPAQEPVVFNTLTSLRHKKTVGPIESAMRDIALTQPAQVYQDHDDALTIAYQSGYYDGKKAAQPAQEPVTWRNAAIRVGEDLCSVGPFKYYDMTAEQWLDWALSVVTVHAPPPQRPWVGLTEEDLKPLCAKWRIVYGGWTEDFARDIEAELKEKNT